MDAALRPLPSINMGSIFRVSILVLVDAALRHFHTVVLFNEFIIKVSILVLVDAALRQH